MFGSRSFHRFLGSEMMADNEHPNWGGKRPGQGRPKGTTGAYKEVTRNLQVAVRLTAEEKAELERRAEEAGLTVSKYIHQILFSS